MIKKINKIQFIGCIAVNLLKLILCHSNQKWRVILDVVASAQRSEAP